MNQRPMELSFLLREHIELGEKLNLVIDYRIQRSKETSLELKEHLEEIKE